MEESEARKALAECAKLVEDAALPPDLRPVAYRVLLERALGASSALLAAVDSGPGVETATAPVSADAPAVDERLIIVARRLRVEPELVVRVLDADEDGLHLQIARAALPQARKSAQQEVALLLSAARQAAGIDVEWTALKLVRQACDALGVLDSPNFSKAISSLHGNGGVRIRGGKELKVNQVGYEAAADLVRRMAGGQS